MSESRYAITWTRPKPTPSPSARVRVLRRFFASLDAKRDAGLTTPEDVVRFDAIQYGDDPVWNTLDVYRPRGVEGPLPVIVSVHGGAYLYGDRNAYQFYCMNLARRGFAVINFSYRLAPEHPYPAQLLDTNLVLCWMVNHAQDYGFDTDNVFLAGDSAGAQIVSQYAVVCTSLIYAAMVDITPPAFGLRAIGLNCGIYDLAAAAKDRRDWVFRNLLQRDPAHFGEQLDVLDYIDSRYPPAYLISAPNDMLCEMLMPMAARLTREGVENRWKLYGTTRQKEVGHVFHLNLRLPEAKQANDDEIAFFRAHMV